MNGRRCFLATLAGTAALLAVTVTGVSPSAGAPAPRVFAPVVVHGPDIAGGPSIQAHPVAWLSDPTPAPLAAASTDPQLLPPTSTTRPTNPATVLAGVILAAVLVLGVFILAEGPRRRRASRRGESAR